ncbi:TPA: hypothetical protein JG832_002525 [Enterobacter hormaechei subsp. xiangfangensis]|nr:hypothetical protein [Enterobacter hormaechei subsp. xiangfangensis]HAV1890660.1 hypothetical protein [Enterobacter hormaechei subsp. xiangfangensis]
MTELLNTLFGGNAWENAFWSSPGGLFVLVTIFLCSVINIVAHWIDDTLIDRIFYSVCALACLATLLHVYEGTEPYNVIKTLLVALALRFLAGFLMRLKAYIRTHKRQKIHWTGH